MCLLFFLQWFNDVYSTDISDKCGDVLHLLSKTYGCQVSSPWKHVSSHTFLYLDPNTGLLVFWFKIAEIVLPELQEMRNAHLVSMGSEQMSCLNPHCIDGYATLPHFFS